jgi:uncharacterized tellurite resistance protein B-like protein
MMKEPRPSKAARPPAAERPTAAVETLQPSTASAAEAARYIADFTAELSALAKQARLDLLAYLLDMAHLEAKRGESGRRSR